MYIMAKLLGSIIGGTILVAFLTLIIRGKFFITSSNPLKRDVLPVCISAFISIGVYIISHKDIGVINLSGYIIGGIITYLLIRLITTHEHPHNLSK